MAELLLELFSEEIPARMQARAAEDLRRLVMDGLKAQGLAAGEAKAYATPRRLTLVVEGVPASRPTSPRSARARASMRRSRPSPASSSRLASSRSRTRRSSRTRRRATSTSSRSRSRGGMRTRSSPRSCRPSLRGFPGRSRCGSTAGLAGEKRIDERWVRPLHSIVCLLDGKVVPFDDRGASRAETKRGPSLSRQ